MFLGREDTTWKEPYPQEAENKVFTEIRWGEDVRFNKEHPRRYEEIVKRYHEGPKRQRQQQRKMSKKPEQPPLVEKPKIINRDSLTAKAHINLLAQPRSRIKIIPHKLM